MDCKLTPLPPGGNCLLSLNHLQCPVVKKVSYYNVIITRYRGYGWENLVTLTFGDGNVWRKWMDEDFGEKSLTNE